MKTIKLKIQNKIDISNELRIYNSIVRYAFNRFQEELKEKEVRNKVNQIWKGQLNSWLIQCAIKNADQLYKKHKNKKIIFGGKYNLFKYLKKQITKEQYKQNKILPLNIQGEAQFKSNRLFNFNENKVILKLNRNNHQEIILPKLRKNLKRELSILQELSNKCKLPITITLNEKFISLTFDEALVNIEKFRNLKDNRILGIDLNPNYIGISVLEFDDNNEFKTLYKELIELKELTKKSYKSSDDNLSKYIVNKRKYESIEICYKLIKLIDYFKCSKLAIEDLKFKGKLQSKSLNRLCRNVWDKNLIKQKLQMLSNIYGFKLEEINPAYSSFIGNILYESEKAPDPILSSIEIGRRAYKKYEKGWFYPNLDANQLNERWKQTLVDCLNWKSAYQKVKNLKFKYRVQLDTVDAVFSKFYIKSKLKIYQFS